MRRPLRYLIALAFTCAIFCSSTALAAFDDYTDTAGHWAEETLRQAHADGYLQGFEDNTMGPDAPVSRSQLLTILCRALDAQKSVSPSVLGLTGTEWYADTAGKAFSMGLISNAEGLAAASLSRGEALVLLSKGFQLTGTEADGETLARYTDSTQLSGEAGAAVSALVSRGYVQGYGNTLQLQASITRAELMTILYRIAPSRMDAASLESENKAGVILTGKSALKDISAAPLLVFDCAAEEISLKNVTAGTVVLRSQLTGNLSLSGTVHLDRLVLSGGTGAKAAVSPSGDSSIDTVVVGDRSGDLLLGGNMQRVEVTGSGQTLTISANLEELVISGSGCQILTGSGAVIKAVRVTEEAGHNHLTLSQDAESLQLFGSQNVVNAAGKLSEVTLRGSGNTLSGTGSVGEVTLYTTRSTVSLPYETLVDKSEPGLENAVVTLSAPSVLPVGEPLTVTASFQTPDEPCQATAIWLLNGQIVGEEAVTVGPDTASRTHTHRVNYSQDMETSLSFEFRLQYTTRDGEVQTVSDATTVTLDNYSEAYYAQYSSSAVLARVQTGYIGDYTLAWAENNDYDDLTKEVWINAKGYSSSTEYIIWISIRYQRVNIFQGSKGNWSLVQSYIVGTGANGHNTPVGSYTVGAREKAGWTHSAYHVSPVVRFTNSSYSGMAFHSRKYNNPSKTRLVDASIGYPISLGCIRMYDEDVQWIYDNIPKGTHVVVY